MIYFSHILPIFPNYYKNRLDNQKFSSLLTIKNHMSIKELSCHFLNGLRFHAENITPIKNLKYPLNKNLKNSKILNFYTCIENSQNDLKFLTHL